MYVPNIPGWQLCGQPHTVTPSEITAMCEFYRGKTCFITLNPSATVWAHTMDAALGSSGPQVDQPLFLSLCSYQRHSTSCDGCWSETYAKIAIHGTLEKFGSMSFHARSLTNTILILRNMIVDSTEHHLFDCRPPFATCSCTRISLRKHFNLSAN